MISALAFFVRTRWRWGLGLVLSAFAGLYAWSFAETYREPPPVAGPEPLAALATPAPEATGPDAPAPRAVWEAARAWSETVNQANPGAIVAVLDADAFGTLHLYVGTEWGRFAQDAQAKQADALGRFWRAYLADAVADWDRGDRFAPGIVLYDWHGVFAYNLNNEVALTRRASFPPELYANEPEP